MAIDQLVLDFPFNPRFQMDNFVVCEENLLIYRAATQLCEDSDKGALNPLLIVGEEGAGKTHLLHAIANRKLSDPADFKGALLSVSHFDQLSSKARNEEETSEILAPYRSLDMLLLDDIHLLEGNEGLQENIFYLYNELIYNGKKVIMASRQHPEKLVGISGFLRSRLLAGAIISIKGSSDTLREAILRKMANDKNFTLTAASARFIGNHCTRDIGQFEGILRKINDFSLSRNRKVSPQLIREALSL